MADSTTLSTLLRLTRRGLSTFFRFFRNIFFTLSRLTRLTRSLLPFPPFPGAVLLLIAIRLIPFSAGGIPTGIATILAFPAAGVVVGPTHRAARGPDPDQG